MSTVHYMRGYSEKELAELWSKLQHVFKDTPQFVAMAVVAMDLLRRLKGDGSDDSDATIVGQIALCETPKVIQDAIDALERIVPTLVGLSCDGLEREESVS